MNQEEARAKLAVAFRSDARVGVWVSYEPSETYGGSDTVFADELDARRHAMDHYQLVVFVPFGSTARDEVKRLTEGT